MGVKLKPGDTPPLFLRRPEAASKDGPQHDGLDWAPLKRRALRGRYAAPQDEGVGLAACQLERSPLTRQLGA